MSHAEPSVDAKPTWRARHARIVKKLGAGAFVFFAVKGLLWLLLPTIAAVLASR